MLAIAVALTGSDQTVRPGAGILQGWSIRETAGAPAAIRIYDGTSAAGTIVGAISLPADGCDNASGLELRVTTGLYVDVVSGAVEGSVHVG